MEFMRNLKESIEDQITTLFAMLVVGIIYISGTLITSILIGYVFHLIYDKLPNIL